MAGRAGGAVTEPEEVQEPQDSDLLISLDEAARLLAVSAKWLRVNRKRLPFVRELAPRVLRVNRAALLKWEARRRA